MKFTLKIIALSLLAACSGTWETSYQAPIAAEVSRNWNVRDVTVVIPEGLTTTEDNSFAPNADIVWHGDPFGDRKVQVAQIVKEATFAGAQPLRGGTPVTLAIVLQEFHALTPKARAEAPSAVHNISYTIQAVNARTGEPITEPQLIRADLEAYTREAAFRAIEQGETQKLRINRHLRNVTAGWLGIGPDPRNTFSTTGR